MGKIRMLSSCLAGISLIAASGSIGLAQEAEETVEIDLGAPACMARPLPDIPQVARAERGQAFRILVVEAVIPALEAKGYVQVECKQADLVLASKRNGYRNKICELASHPSDAVQIQAERALGEAPAVLCAAAEAAVGPWDKTRSLPF